MPQDPFAQYLAKADAHDPFAEFVAKPDFSNVRDGGNDTDSLEGRENLLKASSLGRRRMAGEAITGLRELGGMLRHPVDAAKALGSGVATAAGAVPDVAKLLIDPETRAATTKGFTAGATEGATGIDPTKVAADPWLAAGGFMGRTVLPALMFKGAGAAGGRAIKAIGATTKVVPPGVPGGHLVKAPIKPTAAIGEALESVRKPVPAPSVELPPPVRQPAVSVPHDAAARIRAVEEAERAASGIKSVEAPVAPVTHAAPPVAEAPVAPPKSPTAPPRERRGVPAADGAEPVKYTGVDRRGAENATVRANQAVRAELDAAYADYTGPERRISLKTGNQGFDSTASKIAANEEIGSPNAREVLDRRNSGEAARNQMAEAEGREKGRGTKAPEPEAAALPESWKALVTPEKPALKPVVGPVTPLKPKVTLKPGVAAEARRALGSKKAADHLNRLGLTDQLTPEDVKRLAPGPSRTPLIASNAELDAKYRSSRGVGREGGALDNERGAIDPALLRTVGGAAAGGLGLAAVADDDHKLSAGLVGALGGAAAMNPMKALSGLQKVRVMGMLSGAALPKSLAGNAGAFATAAAERHSLAPIREALRLPTNAKNAIGAWKNNANPAHIAGVGRFNLPARAMGALDATTTQALQRAGLPLEEAQRLLLTNPNTMGAGNMGKAFKGKIGQAAFPFQNTPINGVAEGLKSLDGLAGTGIASQPKHTLTQKALTAGTIAAGAGAGQATDDPRALALLAAFAGPRGIPFALGAGATAGSRVIEKIGVGLPDGAWKDFVDPEQAARPITDPAILRFIAWLKGAESR